jgi:hypothetical protein
MTQIPGLNPVDTAPPANPSGYPQVVTAESLVRLLARLQELERRVTMLERR